MIACVHAAGPASYGISAASGDHYSVGTSNEHTVKGLHGQNVVSSYSKTVDTPHSSVRVSNSKASNDVFGYKPFAYPAAYPAAPVVKAAYPAYPAAYHGYAGYPSPYHGYPAYHGYPYHGYHAPLAAPVYKAPVVAAAPALGSTVSFHGLGVHYGW